MNSKEVIVRILAPSEKPHLPEPETFITYSLDPKAVWQQRLATAASLLSIAATSFILAMFLLKLGISYKEIAVMIGMPLMFGMITRFAIR